MSFKVEIKNSKKTRLVLIYTPDKNELKDKKDDLIKMIGDEIDAIG